MRVIDRGIGVTTTHKKCARTCKFGSCFTCSESGPDFHALQRTTPTESDITIAKVMDAIKIKAESTVIINDKVRLSTCLHVHVMSPTSGQRCVLSLRKGDDKDDIEARWLKWGRKSIDRKCFH